MTKGQREEPTCRVEDVELVVAAEEDLEVEDVEEDADVADPGADLQDVNCDPRMSRILFV